MNKKLKYKIVKLPNREQNKKTIKNLCENHLPFSLSF